MIESFQDFFDQVGHETKYGSSGNKYFFTKNVMVRIIKIMSNLLEEFEFLFRIQIQKGGKVLLWNQVKSIMKACYSELGDQYLIEKCF